MPETLQRFTKRDPCPICQGHKDLPTGQGERCFGFLSSDREYAHCTREQYASDLAQDTDSQTYAHRLVGDCKCGTRHDPNPPASSNGHKHIVATYDYVDARGILRYQTVRYAPKDFRQRRPDGKGDWIWNLKGLSALIYNLPSVLEAIDAKQTICTAEGEEDVHALAQHGYTATCNHGGAEKWGKPQSLFLKGATDVVVFGDHDEVGQRHVTKQVASLKTVGIVARIAKLDDLPGKGDIRDWLKTHTRDDLDQVVRNARPAAEVDAPPKHPEQAPDEDQWIRGSQNKPISCQHNALLWLAGNEYADRIALDTFKQGIMVDGAPLTDDITIEMVRKMEASMKIHWTETHVHSAMVSLGNSRSDSSLRAWLETLRWDQKNRIWKFFALTYGAEDSEYAAMCGQVLFVSAVARAYKPGCKADVCVTLIGNQGAGKSRGIEDLVPDQSWYTDDLGGDLSDKKSGEGLLGKWLVEFAEFERINRATIEGVKAFLSRRVDHYRPPYGRIPKDFPRQCIFIGTTNNQAPLQDLENRRFMPIVCPKLIGNITEDREQLWAEAVHRYKAGEPWWVTNEDLLQVVKARQEEARQHDEWEEILRVTLGNTIKRTTILEAASYVRLQAEDLDKSRQTRLGLALRALGFTRKRETSGSRLWYYDRE